MPTNEKRLRWVVEDFIRSPLAKPSAEALEKVSGQMRQLYRTSIDWRARGGAVGAFGFAVGGTDLARAPDGRLVSAPLSVGQLRALQTTMREMIRRLTFTQERVAIPPVPMFIHRMTPTLRRPERDSLHPRQSARFQIHGQTNRERDAILVGFLELVRAAGGQLYGCPVCRRAFVAHLRQEYCSKPCSQKARNAKRPPKSRRKAG